MEKTYCLIEFYCHKKKCSEQKLKKIEQKLNSSENSTGVKLEGKLPSNLEDGCSCYCGWHLTCQNEPELGTSEEIYRNLFISLEPKVIKIKKIN